ncbi:MAG: MurR/RpiR family transcriptional regulator [Firmicutes bacterium]|nr:MurR/RpiR family transcriptional regulator [Bacillota bacterium]
MAISGVVERLESNLDLLAASEAKVGRWILDHPQDVLSLTVRGLAERAQSSQAAVIRLCHSLQVDGFSALKVLLTADLVRHETHSLRDYPELNPAAGFNTLIGAFSHGVLTSVSETIHGIREQQVEEVARLLAGARRIVLFGMAASRVVADDLYQKLMRLGYPVSNPSDVHVALMSSALLAEHDVAILVSFSGSTEEVLELARLARAKKAAIVAITQFRRKNLLADMANLVFYVTAIEPEPRIGATSSVLASMVVGDALALYMANYAREQTYQHLKATEESVRDHRRISTHG